MSEPDRGRWFTTPLSAAVVSVSGIVFYLSGFGLFGVSLVLVGIAGLSGSTDAHRIFKQDYSRSVTWLKIVSTALYAIALVMLLIYFADR